MAHNEELLAEGTDDGLTPDDIDELLIRHLGSGWTRSPAPLERR